MNGRQPGNIPHFSEKVSPTLSPSIQSPMNQYQANREAGYNIPNPQLTIETDYEDTLATIQYLNKESDELDY